MKPLYYIVAVKTLSGVCYYGENGQVGTKNEARKFTGEHGQDFAVRCMERFAKLGYDSWTESVWE